MQRSARWLVLGAITAALVAVFVARTAVAHSGNPPRLFDLFNVLTVAGAGAIALAGRRLLQRRDWLVAAAAGLLIAATMPLTTLFNPYPFWGIAGSRIAQGVIRGVFVGVAALGGLAIMRRGGPVLVSAAGRGAGDAAKSLIFGAVLGIPLAVANMYANAWTQSRAFAWQSVPAAALDALQPALFEEVVYRLAFLGLLWLALKPFWGAKAVWLAGALSLLVHTYAHYDELFVSQPIVALIMGAALAVIWGMPMTVLAVRRDLESAIGFHWVQDALRFWAGL